MPKCKHFKKYCFLCNENSRLENVSFEVTYHRFPSAPQIKKLWMDFCNLIEGRDDVSNIYICSLHFQDTDYTNLNAKKIGGRLRLKWGVVPSILVPYGKRKRFSSSPEESSLIPSLPLCKIFDPVSSTSKVTSHAPYLDCGISRSPDPSIQEIKTFVEDELCVTTIPKCSKKKSPDVSTPKKVKQKLSFNWNEVVTSNMMSPQNVIGREKMQPESYNTNIFCRLCHNITNYTNYEVIEKVTREVLEAVLPQLVLEEGRKHLMCKTCYSKLYAAFNFKSTCMGTEDIISSYIKSSKVSLVDLKEVYLVVNENIQLNDTWENKRICRLCIRLVTYGFVPLSEVDNNIIHSYLPQVISATKDPIICGSCFDSIRTHGGFLKNCLEAQEKYKNVDNQPYIKTEDIDIKLECQDDQQEYENIDKPSYIKLEGMDMESDEVPHNDDTFSQNLEEKTLENKQKHISDDVEEIKHEYVPDLLGTHGGSVKNGFEAQEKDRYTDNEVYIKTEEMEIELEDGYEVQKTYETIDMQNYIKSEEVEINSVEGDQDNDLSSQNLDDEIIANGNEQVSEDIGEITYEYIRKFETISDVSPQKNVIRDNLKHKTIANLRYKCDECDYKSKTKGELKCHQLTHRDPSEIQMYKCHTCDYQCKRKGDMKWHQLLHKEPSDIQMYVCSTCPYKTKYKKNLKSHQLTHKDSSEIQMYKCDICPYETKYKKSVREHQLLHKDPSEIQMYKCDVCIYETKYKGNLKTHQLIHKDPSEVQMYKCNVCPYESKDKRRIKNHQLLMHKDPSEIRMYACDFCAYKTKYKYHLTDHQLTHKDPSEMQMHKCDTCNFETKHKNDLKTHQLLHKDPSEIQMYMCDTCTFETKYKKHLKSHQLTHKDSSEIEMYKCDLCSYESKYKKCVREHQLSHKNPSEIQMYKCDTCTYETKYKGNLKTHQLIHKDPSEVQMYKCVICTYESKDKGRMKKHQSTHKDPCEIQMYTCDFCDFKTEYKRHLTDHQLTHKDPSKIEMYKCDVCNYETKHKCDLKTHQLLHKDPSEIQMDKCDN